MKVGGDDAVHRRSVARNRRPSLSSSRRIARLFGRDRRGAFGADQFGPGVVDRTDSGNRLATCCGGAMYASGAAVKTKNDAAFGGPPWNDQDVPGIGLNLEMYRAGRAVGGEAADASWLFVHG